MARGWPFSPWRGSAVLAERRTLKLETTDPGAATRVAPPRLAYLDGWRAVAVGIVILSHVSGFRAGPPLLKELARWLPVGQIGVLIFFFISGYVISRAALGEIGRSGEFSVPAFYVRRAFRIIPPLALKGPSLTIRRYRNEKLTASHLINYQSLSPAMVKFLDLAVKNKRNIVISGGTGSGKSTLLNILSNYIPEHERVVTIEDAAELELSQPNLVALETRPADTDGYGAISIRDLVRNSLRMSPDRIVVGECRGGEALDMLQAMNTGHEGSLTTAHANSPRDALSRLEVMVMMAGMDLPMMVVREQISSAIDLIIHQRRFPCGSRKITHVSEITGIESGTIQTQDLFVFRARDQGGPGGKVRGEFTATGAVPEFYEELADRGVPVDLSIFKPERESAHD